MAVLAPQDWHLPSREPTMDLSSSSNSVNSSSISRQRSSPANDHATQPTTSNHNQGPPTSQQGSQPQNPLQQQQPQGLQSPQQQYSYPLQQQPHGSWTPSISAQPFYPSFYQNPIQQQQYPLHATQPSIPPQNPYLWAYQQMIFNAQQAHQLHMSPLGPHPSPAEFFPQSQLPQGFSTFPSGAPPPHPNHSTNSFQQGSQRAVPDQTAGPLYNGFHPYRRPNRPQSRLPEPDRRSSASIGHQGLPQPPYARPDASGSSSSLHSASSHNHSPPRSRTNSNQSAHSVNVNGHSPSGRSHTNGGGGSNTSGASSRSRPSAAPPLLGNGAHGRTSSSSSSAAGPSSSSSTTAATSRHNRKSSTSSVASTASRATTTTSTTAGMGASSSSSAGPRLVRPSPLSQGTSFTVAEKRMSRDDSDLAAMQRVARGGSGEGTPTVGSALRVGLKGRLRRALAFNNAATLEEEDEKEDKAAKLSMSRPKSPFSKSSAPSPSPRPSVSEDPQEAEPPTPPVVQQKKRSRAASLFNARMNMSTDNISLSSTVSSASVMIRKLGSFGKLARRNSLAGITSLFKDKKDKEPGEGEDQAGGTSTSASASPSTNTKKGKKNGKGEASKASVSHVTAELDRSSSGDGDWSVVNNGGEISGLSPAATLARQHTLKSNAEAAAKAKAQKEAAEAAAAVEAAAADDSSKQPNGVIVGASSGSTASGSSSMQSTWDKSTVTRPGSRASFVEKRGEVRVSEDGTRVLIEDEDESNESDGSGGARYGHDGSGSGSGRVPGPHAHQPESYHPERWEEDSCGDDDDELTIRLGLERTVIHGQDGEVETELWALDVRRSVERNRKPAKGILKNAASYDQHAYLLELHAPLTRARSNSYDSPGQSSEIGPLARIPSPDPDHIDGLQRHPSHSSNHSHSHSHSISHSSAPTLPPLSFDSSVTLDSPIASAQLSLADLGHAVYLPAPAPVSATTIATAVATAATAAAATATAKSSFFNLSNSSAPALSTMSMNGNSPPTLTHRSATTPAKRLAFDSNLSVYDTFSAGVYDRRSEPATWSRLTPALAQRIKEELNSYKMEEMEVHVASRMHTQFFV